MSFEHNFQSVFYCFYFSATEKSPIENFNIFYRRLFIQVSVQGKLRLLHLSKVGRRDTLDIFEILSHETLIGKIHLLRNLFDGECTQF